MFERRYISGAAFVLLLAGQAAQVKSATIVDESNSKEAISDQATFICIQLLYKVYVL